MSLLISSLTWEFDNSPTPLGRITIRKSLDWSYRTQMVGVWFRLRRDTVLATRHQQDRLRRFNPMFNEDRPNPDAILARVQEESARAGRGKLKIFFGYAAGVGKTYEMLLAAQRERIAGTDVVVGYV